MSVVQCILIIFTLLPKLLPDYSCFPTNIILCNLFVCFFVLLNPSFALCYQYTLTCVLSTGTWPIYQRKFSERKLTLTIPQAINCQYFLRLIQKTSGPQPFSMLGLTFAWARTGLVLDVITIVSSHAHPSLVYQIPGSFSCSFYI